MVSKQLFGLPLVRSQADVESAPLGWVIRNAARWGFIKGFIAEKLIIPIASRWGVLCMLGSLEITVIKADGRRINYGVVSRRVVTSVGVAFLVDDWDANGQDISTMNYHGCGTGNTAEASGDTALVTESTTALNPNSTRATGTRSQPAANQYRSVGTLTFDGDAAVVEHGLFSDATVAAGVLWDRSVFAAINVVGANADSIQFTYTITLTAGS